MALTTHSTRPQFPTSMGLSFPVCTMAMLTQRVLRTLSFPVCTMALGRDRSSQILSQSSSAISGWDTVHGIPCSALFLAQDPAWPSERRPEELGVEQELPPAQ